MEDNGMFSDTKQTPHLNIHGLQIRSSPDRGRGVYASHALSSGTLIEISPVLFFGAKEYDGYGKHTILDHYAFIWGDGRMALPLGLGSLFNHSSSPNVNYIKKKDQDCIMYRTCRPVEAGEELCIFYGNKLWFNDSSAPPTNGEERTENAVEEELGALGGIDL